MTHTTHSHHRGFVFVELVASIVVVATLAAMILVSSSRSRALGYQAGSLANLHQFASITSSYAADNTDQFWSFSWRSGVPTPSTYPDLAFPPPDPISAIAAQATDIMRRRSRLTSAVLPSTWIPSVLYSPIMLADYLDKRVDDLRFMYSPGDRNRMLWSNDPEGFLNGQYQPAPTDARWLYSSSYRLPLAFTAPDYVSGSNGTICPSNSFSTYLTIPTFQFGGRRVAQVTYPSHKVHLFDSAQWQGGKQPIFAIYPVARVPLLLADGSAAVRLTAEANRGFNPQNPQNLFPATLTYAPLAWEPQVINGQNNLSGSYFLTRNGLGGRDFDGPEVNITP